VSFELMDIGMFYGQQGVEKVKMLPLYQKVDRVVHFDDKFDLVKTQGFQLYTYLDQTFSPLYQKVVFLYDTTTQSVSTYIQVLTTRHQEIVDYVNKTYSQVSVFTKDNMMRLDFNGDGKISLDDLQKSMVGLYEFLKNFDVIENTSQIKCKLYQDAIAYMQSELDEEQKLSEAKKEAAEEHPPISAEQDVQNKKSSKSQKQSKKKHQKQEKSQSVEKTVELAEN